MSLCIRCSDARADAGDGFCRACSEAEQYAQAEREERRWREAEEDAYLRSMGVLE